MSAATVNFPVLNLKQADGVAVNYSVVPASSNAYDLGSSSLPFKDLYLSGNVGVGTGVAQAAVHIMEPGNRTAFRVDDVTNDTTPFIINADGNVGIGTTVARSKLEINGTVLPSACNVHDLGSGDLRWRDLYLSGNTIDLGGTLVSAQNNAISVGGQFINPGGVKMFRNRIINGDMAIDQRNAGAERTGAGVGGLTGSYLTYRTQPTSFYTVDRWAVSTPDIGALTAKQVNLTATDVDAINGEFSTAVAISQVPVDALSLYYPMNSNLTDASGNGVSFTTVGTMQYVPTGPVSNFSLYLANEGNVANPSTAAANYLYAPYTQVGHAVTVSCWMMVTEVPVAAGQYSAIWGFVNAARNTNGLSMACVYASAGIASLFLTYNTIASTSSTSIVVNTWYHVVGVFIPRVSWTLYVNGTSIGSVTANVPSSFDTGSAGAANSFILLGNYHATALAPFAGYLQDFRIYNRALSASEIAALATNVGLSQAPPTTLASGLTTRLTFDNVLTDAQGTLSAPTVTGSTVYNPSCRMGTASLDLTANAAGSTTTVANNYTYTVSGAALPITLACWVNVHTPAGSSYQIPVAFLNSGTSAGLHMSINSSGYAYAYIYLSGVTYDTGSGQTSGPALLNPGTWYHLCATVTAGSIFNFYINGRLTYTIPLPVTATTHTTHTGAAINQFRIGSGVNTTTVYSYKGLIDDVRVYNRALSLNEVKGLYASSQYATASLFQQTLEGRYLTDLGWGTNKAQSLTTSLWLKHTCSTAQQFSLSMNNSGLISWIDFEGSSVADKLGYLTNGTITGAGTYSTSIFKVGSASFNFTANTAGSTPSTYIRYNMPVALQTPFTISLWMYTTAGTGGYQGLFSLSTSSFINNSGGNYSISIVIDSNARVYSDIIINGTSYVTPIAAPTTISANIWYHVSLVVSGNNAIIYINGVNLASRSDIPIGGVTLVYNGAYVSAKIDQLFLGVRSSTADTIAYKGYLDDIRIYNRALSADQIYQLYINNANSTTPSNYTMPRSVVYNTPSIPPNTWQKLLFTIPGDRTGQWMTNNDAGLTLALCMGASSLYSTSNIAAASGNTVSVWNSVPEYAGVNIQTYANSSNDFLGNVANTVYITGVQVEKGEVMTPFEGRPIGTELGLCQRYYQKSYPLTTVPGTAASYDGVIISATITTEGNYNAILKTTMRAKPTLTTYGPRTGSTTLVERRDGGSTANVVTTPASSGSGQFVHISETNITYVHNLGASGAWYLSHYVVEAEL